MTREDLFAAIGTVDEKRLARCEKYGAPFGDGCIEDRGGNFSWCRNNKLLWLIAAVIGIAILLMGSAMIIRYAFPEAPVFDLPLADSAQIPVGNIRISAGDVTATSMALSVTVDQAGGEPQAVCMMTGGPYTIEKLTVVGWEPLPVAMDTSDNKPLEVLTEGSYEWSVNWSAAYGPLENGTYRFTTTILEGNKPVSVEFTVYTTVPNEIEQILRGNAYHIRYTYSYEFGSVEHLSAQDRGYLKEHQETAMLFRHEYWKSGDDLLHLTYRGEQLWIGMMYKDGIRYALDHEGDDRTNPVIGWSRWPALDINRLTEWVNFIAAPDEAVEKEYGANGELKRITIVETDDNFADYYEVETISTEVCQILSTDPSVVAAKFAEQDVNVARPFSWKEEQAKRKALDVEFINTTAQPVANAAEAIDRAMAECTVEHTKIIVYRDEEAGMWKVEFQDGYGYRGYQFVYLDDDGITRMVSGAGSKVEAWKDLFPDP